MSELTLTLLRLGFLALLWLLVLSILAVLRRDLFGTRVVRRTPRPAGAVPAGPGPTAAAAERRPRSPKAGRGCARLVVTEGSLRGTTLSLGQAPILVGRAPESTLVLDDDYASARHARLFPAGRRVARRGPRLDERYVHRLDPGGAAHPAGGRGPGPGRPHRSRASEVAPLAIALRYAARSDVGLVRTEQPGLRVRRPAPPGRRRRHGRARRGDVASSLAIGELAPLDGESHGSDDALAHLERP